MAVGSCHHAPMPFRKAALEDTLASPVTFAPCSNGEYCPPPPSEQDQRAESLWQSLVERQHKRLGISRRQFVQSSCGTATALLVINQVYGCAGSSGSVSDAGRIGKDDAGYGVDAGMIDDEGAACAALSGDEFILDVQTHSAAPRPPWRDADLCRPADEPTDCIGPLRFIKEIFVASDTKVAVLSGVPSLREADPLHIEARDEIRRIVERMGGPRLLLHGNVRPNEGAKALEFMAADAAAFPIRAWKVYPSDGNWRLDASAYGIPFIEQARALNIKVVAAHRGIDGDENRYTDRSSPVDLTRAASMFPDMTFLCYHSGWDGKVREDHPFDPSDPNPRGIDRLIKGVLDHGARSNVYAELGSTWRNLMTKPEEAAHALGKLLKYLGPDKIVWGTDALFTGTPQEQIVAFRAFAIPEKLREQHGYPALCAETKRKILGLNAAKVYGVDPNAVVDKISGDEISQFKLAAADDPRSVPLPGQKSYGPRTRREFINMMRLSRVG